MSTLSETSEISPPAQVKGQKRWTARQQAIYSGLRLIGQEIAGFYEAALKIYYCNDYPNGAYFLLHAAREIDGGLRDVLDVDYVPEEKEEGRHKKSILFSLGVDKYEGLAIDWYEASKELHGYAHRHGAWKEPRKIEDAKAFWGRFENVLERLIGSYFAIIERIERIGKIENLEEGVIGTLCNMLSIPTYYNYFFRSERNIKWFRPLSERGYFSPSKIKFDKENNAFFWNALDYLERVSQQLDQNPGHGMDLIKILGDVVRFSQETNRINNYHIWWYCVKILNNLPTEVIQQYLPIEDQREDTITKKYGLKSWFFLWVDPNLGGTLAIHDISEKLLPKFLADDHTREYAETIVEVITRIRASKKSSFAQLHEAVLVCDEHWVTEAFRLHSKIVGEKCSIKTLENLADKLKRALEYKRQDSRVTLKVSGRIYELKIKRMALKNLSADEIGFQDDQHECVLTQYMPEQIAALDLTENDWALYQVKPQGNPVEFSISATTCEDFIAQTKNQLSEKIGKAEAGYFEEHLGVLFDGLYDDYSQVWCRSLQHGPEHAHGAGDILTIILRDVLLAKCDAAPVKSSALLRQFLGLRYRFPIFRRFTLLCALKHWSAFATLFEQWFMETPLALRESNYQVELHDILKTHNQHFSPELIQELKQRIAQVPASYTKDGKAVAASWQHRWLSPLREHAEFAAEYQAALKQAQPKDGKPYEPERSAFQGGLVVHRSPKTKDEILQMSVTEFVQFWDQFEGADDWRGTFEGEPDRKGLAEAFYAAVKENPQKFTDEIALFPTNDYLLIHNLMRGLRDAWRENKELDWEKILHFALEYLGKGQEIIQEALRAQGEDSGGGKFIWVVEDIVDLIEDGCRDDAHAFDPRPEYFDTVERIFNQIQPLLRGEQRIDPQRDVLTSALNTTLGRTIMSYISFALRVARATKHREDHWGQNKYEHFFAIGIEAYSWFGRFLPNFRYLDKPYTDGKIRAFVERPTGDPQWQAFMEGYLSGSQVYKELYFLMRSHYTRAIEHKVLAERIDERLVDHMIFGYLHYEELLQPHNADGQPGLFWKMLDEAKTEERRDRWLEVAGSFWSWTPRTLEKKEQHSDDKPVLPEIREKILAFWAWTYQEQEFVQAHLGDKYGVFLGRMAKLTILLKKIDEAAEQWLLLCAPHIEREYNTTFIVEYLAKFEDEESVKRIAKIFLETLKHITPTFRDDYIKQIIERIYQVGEKGLADEICDTYGRRGVHFLREIWTAHNR